MVKSQFNYVSSFTGPEFVWQWNPQLALPLLVLPEKPAQPRPVLERLGLPSPPQPGATDRPPLTQPRP